nr:Metazoa galactosyltransferase domain containing protein [Haemonchus contortus]
MYDWQCYIFHDVDLLPEDDRNLHVCPEENPRHMAVAINKFNYKLYYEEMFGTSSALTKDQFNATNGFSNRYWGWGGEDDDMYHRIIYAGYKVDRYNETVARYTMIKHEREPKVNPVNPKEGLAERKSFADVFMEESLLFRYRNHPNLTPYFSCICSTLGGGGVVASGALYRTHDVDTNCWNTQKTIGKETA